MTSYFYLLSSLPTLSADAPCPMPYEEFLDKCRVAVGMREWELLARLSLAGTEHPLTADWAERYAAFVAELSDQRDRKRGKPTGTRPKNEALSRAVGAAVDCPDPLEAEKMLTRALFGLVDEWVGMHTFDLHALAGYALKCKLSERVASFRQTEGKNELTRVVSVLEDAIARMEQEG